MYSHSHAQRDSVYFYIHSAHNHGGEEQETTDGISPESDRVMRGKETTGLTLEGKGSDPYDKKRQDFLQNCGKLDVDVCGGTHSLDKVSE